jgi:hypothetical protein
MAALAGFLIARRGYGAVPQARAEWVRAFTEKAAAHVIALGARPILPVRKC